MNKKAPFSPDEYLRAVYETHPSPFAGAKTREEVAAVCAEVKEKLSDALCVGRIPLKKETLSPVTLGTQKRRGYTVSTVSVEICEGLFMLCYVLKGEKPTSSGIVAMCGHGYGCRQIIRQSKQGSYRRINFFDNYQKNFAEALALDGHTVIVPEPIGFGQARLFGDRHKPFYISSCETVSMHSLLYGLSTAALRVYQLQRCVDLLEKEYGCSEFGCMGISGGGLVSLYGACVEDRIESACVCGYINTFRTSVLSMWHCPDNYIPGLLNIGEVYDLASSAAGKRLMMQFGTKDRLFPLEGSRTAAQSIRKVYEALGCGEKFLPVEFDGKHEVSLPQAVAFFRRNKEEKEP